MSKEGTLDIFCGRTRTGKTSEAMKRIADEKKVFCYDFQNHYENLTYFNEGNKVTQEGLTLVRTMSDFDEQVNKNRNGRLRVSPVDFDINKYLAISKVMRGYTMLIEEATGLFPNGRISQDMIEQVLSKRHTGNSFIFIFHSMHRVPPQMYEFIDSLYLFKTNDLEKNMKSKFPTMIENGTFRRIQNEKNPFYFEKLEVNDFL